MRYPSFWHSDLLREREDLERLIFMRYWGKRNLSYVTFLEWRASGMPLVIMSRA